MTNEPSFPFWSVLFTKDLGRSACKTYIYIQYMHTLTVLDTYLYIYLRLLYIYIYIYDYYTSIYIFIRVQPQIFSDVALRIDALREKDLSISRAEDFRRQNSQLRRELARRVRWTYRMLVPWRVSFLDYVTSALKRGKVKVSF